MELNKIYHGHADQVLKTFPDQVFNTIVTSPPYWMLRNYGIDETVWPEVVYMFFGIEITVPPMTCCLGLEPTPQQFIGHMVYMFREARRTLKDDGTIWVNMGDSYAAAAANRTDRMVNGATSTITGKNSQLASAIVPNKIVEGLKPKDMAGIPWMLAFALRDDGWYLRQDIIWSKPNPMPESVTDRCTKSHEYIFLLSKSQKYYFDQNAILEPASPNTHARLSQDVQNQVGSDKAFAGKRHNGNMKASKRKLSAEGSGTKNNTSFDDTMAIMPIERNKRSVWTVTTQGVKHAHTATFPERLIVDCIKAGCPEGGIVLDIFMGSGTTGLVSRKLNRNFVGIDLSEKYINEIANPRLNKELGLFK